MFSAPKRRFIRQMPFGGDWNPISKNAIWFIFLRQHSASAQILLVDRCAGNGQAGCADGAW